MGDVISI